MKDLFTVEAIVKEVLTTDQRARYDDMYLYLKVAELLLGYDVSKSPFGRIMMHYTDMGLPHFESVRRCRQKVQAAYEDLQPEDKRQRRRTSRQIDYQLYAGSYLDGNRICD